MKGKLIVSFLAITVLLGSSCKKDSTAHVSKEVKVSYPSIALNGDEVLILDIGDAYTDAGAKLTDDISGAVTEIEPTTNPVTTAQAGLFVVNFIAANANGFETRASRIVIVAPATFGADRTGTYLRAATGVNCVITKETDGVYKVNNPGGAGVGADTYVYFVETAPNTFSCPPQPTVEGTMGVNNIVFTATGSTWNVANAGYGTQQRVFVKQ